MPYFCKICNKAFRLNDHLTQHKKIHSGEKPYSCDKCEKSFLQQSQLTERKRLHTGEKPYSCETCEKAFLTNYELTVHREESSICQQLLWKKSFCENLN